MRGFSGCLGSIDYQHWQWERGPVSAGQFTGKEKKPTLVLEGIADGELWIWHAFFGNPGSLNDLNIQNISSTMASILQGKHPPRFTFTVAEKLYSTPYYLADGIYPSWAMFIKTLRKASSPQTRRFSAAQEAVRKDIERAFGVLISRFHILKRPCVLRDRKVITSILRACILMHNMIVESLRNSYESGLYTEAVSQEFGLDIADADFEWQDQVSLGLSAFPVSGATPVGEWSNTVEARYNEFTSRSDHAALTNSLIEHIWSRYGAGEDDW
jgi:hypothetical protein